LGIGGSDIKGPELSLLILSSSSAFYISAFYCGVIIESV
jgi:hypothetical protein